MKIEIDKPVVPQFVADWIESLYDESGGKYSAIGIMLEFTSRHDKPVHDWFLDNKDEFINAVMHGYEVEEPLYYAKIKGWEHLLSRDYFWNYDKGISNFIIAHKLHSLGFLTKMTKSDWNELGINDSNADFEEAEQ